MDWKKKCFAALDAENMFENAGHRSRFREMVDCFSGYPFFTKGVCKCIFMSSWDETHFCVLLETLTDLSLGKETTTKEMQVKGDAYADEQTNIDDYYMYQLSLALLDGRPFHVDEDVKLSPDYCYIIERVLKAAAIIDRL
jgi:hypothetical protein